MTFDDVRKLALAWPEVEDGSSYGTPALKVRKKLLARLREDDETLVMLGVPQDEREMLIESQPKIYYFTDHYRDYPTVLIRLSNAKRITFEYVMIKGVNDSIEAARRLVKLLKGIPAKVNLIPFNPWPGTDYECSDWDQIEKFAQVVLKAGYASPVRTPRGRDILAACGQLKSASERMKKTERDALAASRSMPDPASAPVSGA